jgi:hypothetical protein
MYLTGRFIAAPTSFGGFSLATAPLCQLARRRFDGHFELTGGLAFDLTFGRVEDEPAEKDLFVAVAVRPLQSI